MMKNMHNELPVKDQLHSALHVVCVKRQIYKYIRDVFAPQQVSNKNNYLSDV